MIGETISHYKIIEKLGEGGMGVVYKALDTTLDRHVAIKFLPPHLSKDEEARKRFIHEAKAASALDHVNIGTIYEVDKTSDGRTFIVMAYYGGTTLRERINQGSISVDEALNIVSQIASGLARAHEKEIVHRDIKPSNIIITKRGEAKIIDFGLAKLAGKTRLTKEGTTLGTVAYMSPEQAKGEETDHRSDIFSLGVILYELLSGEPPFKGEHEAALLYEIVHESPKPLAMHQENLPAAVVSIVEKALKKVSAERYQDASEIKREIAEYTQRSAFHEMNRSGEKHPGGGSFSKIKLWGSIAAAAVIIAVIISIIRPSLFDDEAVSEELTLAIIDFRDLSNTDDQSISIGLTSFLHIGLDESSPIRVISSDLIYDIRRRRFGSGRGAIEPDQVLEVARASKSTMFLTGQIMASGDEWYVTWRLVETSSGENFAARQTEDGSLAELADQIIAEALPLIDRQSEAEIASTSVPVDRITTDSEQAYEHFVAGMDFESRNQGLEARDEWQRAISLDPNFALAHLELGRLYWSGIAQLRDANKANKHLGLADSLKSRLGSKDRLRLEAALYDRKRQVMRSIETYEMILEKWPDDRQTLIDLHQIYYRYWDFKAAGEIAKKGLELYPDDINSFGSPYVAMLTCLGRPGETLPLARKHVKSQPNNPNLLDDLSFVFLALGLPDSAEVYALKAYELDPSFGTGSRLPECAYSAGDLDRAIALTEEYLERDDLIDTARHWLMLVSTIELGLSALYREAGMYRRAIEIVNEARQYSRHHMSGWTSNKGWLLLYTGRAQEAMEISKDLIDNYDDAKAVFTGVRIRAHAAVALGDIAAAHAAVEELFAAEEHFGAMAIAYALKTKAAIALVEGEPTNAIEALDRLYERGGRPGGFFDIECREIRARAYQQVQRPDLAAEVHKELLRVYGGHALSHYELGKLYEEMNRPDDAKNEYMKFLEMWSNADEGLPQVEDARKRLAKLKGV